MKLSSDPRKKKDDLYVLETNKSDKFLSSIESISNSNNNPNIDLDVSYISDLKANDKLKKLSATSFSSSSFTNIINNLNQDNEEEKDGNAAQDPNKKLSYNLYSDNKNKYIPGNVYSSDYVNAEEKIPSMSKEKDFIKKKENFIPKSEILQKSLCNPNDFSQDTKKENLHSIMN
jgi:hypothetical protein